MGYDLHITRQELHWEREESKKIPFTEWKAYVENDPELSFDYSSYVEFKDEPMDGRQHPAIWTPSQSQDKEEEAAFWYRKGDIGTKNPTQNVINKMVAIADSLNARVQGDDGEFYIAEDYYDNHLSLVRTQNNKSSKPWWKFW